MNRFSVPVLFFLLLSFVLVACSPATIEPSQELQPAIAEPTVQALTEVEVTVNPTDEVLITPQVLAQATDPYPVPTPTSDGSEVNAGYPVPNYTPPAAGTSPVNDCNLQEVTLSGVPINLQTLQISEPSVVLDPSGASSIFGWMTNDELLLVHPYRDGQHIMQSLSLSARTVVTHAVTTSTILPIWFDNGQSIVYETSVDVEDGSSEQVVMLEEANGSQEVLIDDFVWYSVSSTNSGDIYYFEDFTSDTIQKYSMATRSSMSTSIKPSEWVSADYTSLQQYGGFTSSGYSLAINSSGDKGIISQFPVTFLYDFSTNRPCEIRLGKTLNSINAPLQIKWSPNGRYIAFENAPRNHYDRWGAIHLGVIDLQTNSYYYVQPSPANYIADFQWSPDSRYIAVLGKRNQDSEEMGLFILETESGAYAEFLENELLGQGATLRNHAWSPDGSRMAIECPETIETLHDSRICTVDIEEGN